MAQVDEEVDREAAEMASGLPHDTEDRLIAGLRRLEGRARYVEAMAGAHSGLELRHDDRSTAVQTHPRIQGAVFRAWDGAGWVEAATSGLDAPGLSRTVEALERRLRSSQGPSGPPGPSAEGSRDAATSGRRPIDDEGIEERIDLARELARFGKATPGIKNVIVRIDGSRDERRFVNSVGARRGQRIDRVSVSVVPVAMEGSRAEFDYLGEGGAGGWEVLDRMTEERIRAAAADSVGLLAASPGPIGRMTVVLDPSTAGTFAHESFGHGTEADQILRKRSYLAPHLGEAVGPSGLTLVDDGSLPDAWGSIYFDDEGAPSRRNVLVDHGRFTGLLHDRESAAALGHGPTGNCRRSDVFGRPYVRMTNTFVDPGDWAVEELLREAGSGVVLERAMSGVEDPLGGQMQLTVRKGHLIEKGERGALVPGMSLSGRVLDVLRSVRAVSRVPELVVEPGFCGKGHTDLLPAGTGGAYVLTEAIVGRA